MGGEDRLAAARGETKADVRNVRQFLQRRVGPGVSPQSCGLLRLPGDQLVGVFRTGHARLFEEAAQDRERIGLIPFQFHVSGPRLDIVGGLLEDDILLGECCLGQARLFAVDRERAGKIRVPALDLAPNPGQRRTRQHVAVVRLPVAEDAVVQQRVGAAFMDPEERRLVVDCQRASGLAEVDVGGKHGKGDI